MSTQAHTPGRDEASWIVQVHDACHGINTTSHVLEGIARSLHRVGMEKLAGELDDIAGFLSESQDGIKKACGQELSRSVAVAQENTAGLLALAIHGAMKPFAKAEGR